jgi:hypothetical protein
VVAYDAQQAKRTRVLGRNNIQPIPQTPPNVIEMSHSSYNALSYHA